MDTNSNRRGFLKKTAAVALTVPLLHSLEEYALAAQEGATPATPAPPPAGASLPTGTIGKVKISRLICGGNLISGYAHSRDLIYVSSLLKHYFTDEKILETWSMSERYGVNTMILNPVDTHAAELYKTYRARGGKIQFLAQLNAEKNDLVTPVKIAQDLGAVGAVLVGNCGDAWTREGDVKLIGQFLAGIRAQGMIAGIAGHELRTVMEAEKAGLAPDFYMKTLHSTNYWSKRQADQVADVIDNGPDNYWCRDPKETIAYMSELKRPWLAYKVLAAGAISPKVGFQHAFENGADFAVVGMFDFQIAEDAAAACEAVKANLNRDRSWCA